MAEKEVWRRSTENGKYDVLRNLVIQNEKQRIVRDCQQTELSSNREHNYFNGFATPCFQDLTEFLLCS